MSQINHIPTSTSHCSGPHTTLSYPDTSSSRVGHDRNKNVTDGHRYFRCSCHALATRCSVVEHFALRRAQLCVDCRHSLAACSFSSRASATTRSGGTLRTLRSGPSPARTSSAFVVSIPGCSVRKITASRKRAFSSGDIANSSLLLRKRKGCVPWREHRIRSQARQIRERTKMSVKKSGPGKEKFLSATSSGSRALGCRTNISPSLPAQIRARRAAGCAMAPAPKKLCTRLRSISSSAFVFESRAKATKGKAGMAGVTGPVRRSTAGTGLRVGVSSAGLTATSEFMDVTAGETAPLSVGWSSPVARLAHNQEVASSNLAPATSSGDGLGIHEPGSNTRGFAVMRQPASGRARDRAICPAVARCFSKEAA